MGMCNTGISRSGATNRSRRLLRGFTLIEILIVVVVLGILAALTVPHFGQASEEAEQTAAHSQLKVLRGQITLYWAKHGTVTPLGTNTNLVVRALQQEGMLAAPLSDNDPATAGFQVAGGYTLTWDPDQGVLDALAPDGSSSDW